MPNRPALLLTPTNATFPSRSTCRFRPRAFALPAILISAILALAGCAAQPPHDEVAAPQPAPAPILSPASPPAPVEAAPAAPEEVAPPVLVEEDNVFFLIRSALISAEDKEKLKRHAGRLIAAPRATVTLIGHTDELGSRSYNLALTEERLSAVNKQLRSYGVSPRQIRRNRLGSVRGRTGCTTAECRDRMRRVELVYTP